MKTLCGIECKEVCNMYGAKCKGCNETSGKPFGGECVAYNLVKNCGRECLESFKKQLINEINALNIPELIVTELFYLNGAFVNLEYTNVNGSKTKYLNDNDVYMGCQVERSNNNRCYGVVANESFILVSEYGCNGSEPELILYKKR